MSVARDDRDRSERKGASASRKAPSDAGKNRVYIVDDHVMVRQGLTMFINDTADLMVCGESSSGEEALQQIPRSGANLAIVDLSLEGMGGLELTKSLHVRHPDLPVLVLSMHDEVFFAERALRAGASGYVMKHLDIGDLEEAIRRVLEGGIHVSKKISDRLLKIVARTEGSPPATSMDLLSDREMEIFDRIGRGLGNTEIAHRLHLSIKTVESYRARIKEKLGMKDATELFQHAMVWIQGGESASSKSRP